MKHTYLNLFLLILSYSSFAQQTYDGTIINKQTQAPIPYITVKLIKEQVATSADEKGSFKINSNKPNANDTLLFTGVGYLSVKLPVNNYRPQTIEMSEDAIYLSEISISKKKKHVERENIHSFSFADFGFTETRFMHFKQIAKRFDCKKENALLEKIRIGRVVSSDFRNTYARFRIHVYDIDPSTGAPSDDLTHEIIEVEDQDNSYIDVDLTKYGIIITKKAFFIAVEWLYIPRNECYVERAFPKYNIYQKYVKSRANYLATFQPIIYHVPYDKSVKRPYTWVMNMGDRWLNYYHFDTSRSVGEAAISAQVIY